MKRRRPHDNRPLILLDVDGVINSYEHRSGHAEMLTLQTKRGGTVVTAPYMPSLLQHLSKVAEIKWCTAWRNHAATSLAPVLGLPEFEVVTDGLPAGGGTAWKPGAARTHIIEALAEEREVFWIEDFAGMETGFPLGLVKMIDTTKTVLLRPDMLPSHLIEGWDWEGERTFPTASQVSWWEERQARLIAGAHATLSNLSPEAVLSDLDRIHEALWPNDDDPDNWENWEEPTDWGNVVGG